MYMFIVIYIHIYTYIYIYIYIYVINEWRRVSSRSGPRSVEVEITTITTIATIATITTMTITIVITSSSSSSSMIIFIVFLRANRIVPFSTPGPPTKSFPTKSQSPWVKLSERLPIKLYGHENSHPLELRVC